MLEAMLNHVEAGYTANGNPYHNNMHACDVLQTTHYFISQTGVAVSPLPCLPQYAKMDLKKMSLQKQKTFQTFKVDTYSACLAKKLEVLAFFLIKWPCSRERDSP